MKPFCLWFTGLPGAGKTTLARAFKRSLDDRGIPNALLDGDEIRSAFPTGFTLEDRAAHIARVAFMAARVVDAGGIAIVSLVSPYGFARLKAVEIVGFHRFVLVYVSTPAKICEERDPKGLWKAARAGTIQHFTGVSDPYEPPLYPAFTVDTSHDPVESSMAKLESVLLPAEIPRALFIGRWQPFHNGHKHIIDKVLDGGRPVAIGVRDTPVSSVDPFTVAERIEMIEAVYAGRDVLAFKVPDISSVEVGRDTGYAINRHEVPDDVKGISATEIRRQVLEGSSDWRSRVPEASQWIVERIRR